VVAGHHYEEAADHFSCKIDRAWDRTGSKASDWCNSGSAVTRVLGESRHIFPGHGCRPPLSPPGAYPRSVQDPAWTRTESQEGRLGTREGATVRPSRPSSPRETVGTQQRSWQLAM